jgi:hypothetical protein
LEDECLIDVWKAVSLDPISGANQTFGKYYKMIVDQFNECHHIGEYRNIQMIQNEGAISHGWGAIKVACKKFHGCLEMIQNMKQSGASMIDYVYVSQVTCLSSYPMIQ